MKLVSIGNTAVANLVSNGAEMVTHAVNATWRDLFLAVKTTMMKNALGNGLKNGLATVLPTRVKIIWSELAG